EAARFRAIFQALADADMAGAGMTTAEIIKATEHNPALRDAVAELCDCQAGKAASSRVLSNRLKRFRDRVYRGQALEAREGAGGIVRWRIASVSDSRESSDSPTPLTYARAPAPAHTDSGETESPESSESLGNWEIDGEERG